MLTPSKSDSGRHQRGPARRALLFACRFSLAAAIVCALTAGARADHLHLSDGTSIEVDEAWEDAQGIWYRRGGVTHLIERARVRTIERTRAAEVVKVAPQKATVNAVDAPAEGAGVAAVPVWIYLVGGARVEADEATESPDGVWYRRGNLSIFVERARIERIERESPEAETPDADSSTAARVKRRERGWSTGSARLDTLIRQSGGAYGVDPYLIFCVMEQESHFNSRALSPKGARGLMQLMPGTAARFGVRNGHDPSQNIRGGTRYLKDLLRMFGGRVDLVLASYNAGEGAVRKYGHRVPPYRETRNYVRRISARYQRGL